MKEFIWGLPKAELHVHVEGTLEPELMLELADRNGVELPFQSVEQARAAYQFSDLQSFLDIYYQGSRVLLTDEDFFQLTWAYLNRAVEQGVQHVELFFDPQAHTDRGVPFETVITGIQSALRRADSELNISSELIMCFLRHLTAASAMETLQRALPFKDQIVAVGLDSSERGNPPSKFQGVFQASRKHGFLCVAHAGEEGPPAYISESLDLLSVRRIDHGVRCVEDPELVQRLVSERIPLTVCPLSNISLRVFDTMRDHSIKQMMDAGLLVTINSDDPPYFGGYIADNFLAVQEAFELTQQELRQLARNSFEASFLSDSEKRRYVDRVNSFSTAPA